MGNEGSRLGDDADEVQAANPGAGNIGHFDHSFKSELHYTHGPHFAMSFGELQRQKKLVQMTCKPTLVEFLDDNVSNRKVVQIMYKSIAEVGFDHSTFEIKFVLKVPAGSDEEQSYVIFNVPDSVEFEKELRLRLIDMSQKDKSAKMPPISYVGVFAGETKPKPFQRKRPILSSVLPTGKLPPLAEMRNTALELHKGSYKPCPPGQSRRIELAIQHIFDGYNTFPVTYVRGQPAVANLWRLESLLLVTESMIVFKPNGVAASGGGHGFGNDVEIMFSDILEWTVEDNESVRQNDSGINIYRKTGEHHYFGFPYIRDVMHTLEFFWNKYMLLEGRPVKLGSTHGRPIHKIHTLYGEEPAPEAMVGSLELYDADGSMVYPGRARSQSTAPSRRASIGSAISMKNNEERVCPMENPNVKKHWKHVVKHQGWMLKKGGIGLLNAKEWIKRYFVLYNTSQGHFLAYYTDITECPLFTQDRNQRNMVDCAKTCFIRPGSNKSDLADTPPHSFDIVTIEREWTLCAETADNAHKWLQMLMRGCDEDVAIIPDEDLIFKVKPKVDALGVFNPMDYSTTLKISANAVTVCSPDPNASAVTSALGTVTSTVNSLTTVVQDTTPMITHCVWVYTDFYKWSLMTQNGKLALMVNVFADASFSRKLEFVFRTKEAVRLATAVEFYIEKFMSCMHLRLENELDADGHYVSNEVVNKDTSAQRGNDRIEQQVQQKQVNLLDMDDDFGMGDASISTSAPITTSAPASVIETSSPTKYSSDFDFFGDSFGSTSVPVTSTIPLTQQQIAQHGVWRKANLAASGGPMYDDGSLQIAAQVEIRGSQGRITLHFRNHGNYDISELNTFIVDSAGLLRFESAPMAPTLAAGAQTSTQVMVECMKIVSVSPSLNIKYKNGEGSRDNTIEMPLTMASFNEPLALVSNDFMSKWERVKSMAPPAVESFGCDHANFETVQKVIFKTFKFGPVQGMPDASNNCFYGAATLRLGSLESAEKISVGCLLKVEINPQGTGIRVTCGASNQQASTVIVDLAKKLLGH